MKCEDCKKWIVRTSFRKKRAFCNRECFVSYLKKEKEKRISSEMQFNMKKIHITEYIERTENCEICGNSEKANTVSKSKKSKSVVNKLSRDHNHETGNFRGALCYSCNVKLGWYESLSKEINEYLKNNNDFDKVKKKMGSMPNG